MASKKAPPSATLIVLREIRDELKEIRAEATKTNERVDALYRYVPEVEMRVATAFTEMVGAIGKLRDSFGEMRGELRDVRDLLRGSDEDRKRMNDHEQRLVALERKTG
jgi:uncharacterized coiled-coil DUF342 family protein